MFPADRGWLVSRRWDDAWTCLGGPRALVGVAVADPHLRGPEVAVTADATPAGYLAF